MQYAIAQGLADLLQYGKIDYIEDTEMAEDEQGYSGAFTTLGAVELKAGHNPNNTASRKVLLKLGFQYETDEFYEPTGLYHPLYRYLR